MRQRAEKQSISSAERLKTTIALASRALLAPLWPLSLG
jgi:hypothetical protein